MNSKAWKLSASVIIALRSNFVRESAQKVELLDKSTCEFQSSDKNNLHILSLRRGESDRHLPGIHVFPGGHLDDSDKNPEWIDLYKSFGYEENSFLNLAAGGGVEHLPEYKDACLPGWMSLRLCAIRETFEESGILLCRTPSGADSGPPFASFTILNELVAWQSRVRADPRQMLALCHTIGCVPDLWGLHLWSNWLTPTQQRIRHNSIFFLAVLRALPPHVLDNSEMDELKWCSASELVSNAGSGQLRLANPQLYEASRLSGFTDADVLAVFAAKRAQLGCERTMPVQEITKDGMLFILPGDSAYPKNVDFEAFCEMQRRQVSFENLRESVREENGILHRIEVPRGSTYQRVVTHNYVPPYQHVSPVIVHSKEKKFNSKI